MPELHYWISKKAIHSPLAIRDSDLVIIATEKGIRVFEMSEDDGLRSHCDEYFGYDNVTLWAKCEVDLQDRQTVLYDTIEFDMKTRGSYDVETRTEDKNTHRTSLSESESYIRAWRNGKVVFEIGTEKADSYYPSYFMYVEETQIY